MKKAGYVCKVLSLLTSIFIDVDAALRLHNCGGDDCSRDHSSLEPTSDETNNRTFPCTAVALGDSNGVNEGETMQFRYLYEIQTVHGTNEEILKDEILPRVETLAFNMYFSVLFGKACSGSTVIPANALPADTRILGQGK